MSSVGKVLKEHNLIHFYQALTFMAPDQKKKKIKLSLIKTSPLSNEVKGCEIYIIFNYSFSTKTEIVALYKT